MFMLKYALENTEKTSHTTTITMKSIGISYFIWINAYIQMFVSYTFFSYDG